MIKWFKLKTAGLFCVPGNFYIDPIRPVDLALITHAHNDHVCVGSKKFIATKNTIEIIKLRHSQQHASYQAIPFNRSINLNGVKVKFLPAGHILGSAQILLEYQGERVIISGDYKRQPDPTCDLFEAQPCDLFVTEATFGLPIFKHPPITEEIAKLLASLNEFKQHTHLVAAYALGKTQRMILSLRAQGYDEPIYMHGSNKKICDYYERLGFSLGKTIHVTPESHDLPPNKIVFCPPQALNDRWTRRFKNIRRCYASGWMRTRARAKQKHVELPLIISDHADWGGLLKTVAEVKAPNVWIMHGEDALQYELSQQGYQTKILPQLYSDVEDE